MEHIKSTKAEPLHYHGANFFRLRVVLATLFQRPLHISDIRCDAINPGVQKYEANLLRLIDKVTDGGRFFVDVTGTEVRYTPGRLVGGDDLVHDCGTERNISYFLEALMLLAPFAKKPLSIKLKGITHGSACSDAEAPLDPSIDLVRSVFPSIMTRMGVATDGMSVALLKRGVAPLGKGEVEFSCPVVRKVQPFQLIEEGRVKRVRGVAYTSKVSPQFAVRMIDRVRCVLNDFLPDVWVYHAASKLDKDGPSPGYGITLIAETMKGHMKGVDVIVDETTRSQFDKLGDTQVDAPKLSSYAKISVKELLQKDNTPVVNPQSADDSESPAESNEKPKLSEQEYVGVLAAQRLLLEIHYGGVVGTSFQHIPLLFMAMAEEHQLCKIKLSRLTPYTVQFLRHVKDFSGVQFGFEKVCSDNQENCSGEGDCIDYFSNQVSEQGDNSSKSLPRVPQVIVKCIGLGYRNIGKSTF